eukprot:TRINITY_DN3973_c0_g1_i1.p1 TRINITY_DN3973_c0_g1~~TRINITY_DN3973_c0_g1_i1.p1  ORF type:complete len:851 (+),score=368.46 TRINITY_DN3973_c0_g1_i1:42-2555(+)
MAWLDAVAVPPRLQRVGGWTAVDAVNGVVAVGVLQQQHAAVVVFHSGTGDVIGGRHESAWGGAADSVLLLRLSPLGTVVAAATASSRIVCFSVRSQPPRGRGGVSDAAPLSSSGRQCFLVQHSGHAGSTVSGLCWGHRGLYSSDSDGRLLQFDWLNRFQPSPVVECGEPVLQLASNFSATGEAASLTEESVLLAAATPRRCFIVNSLTGAIVTACSRMDRGPSGCCFVGTTGELAVAMPRGQLWVTHPPRGLSAGVEVARTLDCPSLASRGGLWPVGRLGPFGPDRVVATAAEGSICVLSALDGTVVAEWSLGNVRALTFARGEVYAVVEDAGGRPELLRIHRSKADRLRHDAAARLAPAPDTAPAEDADGDVVRLLSDLLSGSEPEAASPRSSPPPADTAEQSEEWPAPTRSGELSVMPAPAKRRKRVLKRAAAKRQQRDAAEEAGGAPVDLTRTFAELSEAITATIDRQADEVAAAARQRAVAAASVGGALACSASVWPRTVWWEVRERTLRAAATAATACVCRALEQVAAMEQQAALASPSPADAAPSPADAAPSPADAAPSPADAAPAAEDGPPPLPGGAESPRRCATGSDLMQLLASLPPRHLPPGTALCAAVATALAAAAALRAVNEAVVQLRCVHDPRALLRERYGGRVRGVEEEVLRLLADLRAEHDAEYERAAEESPPGGVVTAVEHQRWTVMGGWSQSGLRPDDPPVWADAGCRAAAAVSPADGDVYPSAGGVWSGFWRAEKWQYAQPAAGAVLGGAVAASDGDAAEGRRLWTESAGVLSRLRRRKWHRSYHIPSAQRRLVELEQRHSQAEDAAVRAALGAAPPPVL